MSNKCLLCSSNQTESTRVGGYQVIKCNNCEFQYIPNSKDILGHNYFDSYYLRRKKFGGGLNALRKEQYKVDAKFVSHYVKNSGVVLDVGCSMGGFIESMNNDHSIDFYGIDIDKSAIDSAKSQNTRKNVFFENVNLTQFNRPVDTVVFRGTFQYLDVELHNSINHIKKILKKDGKIILLSLPTTDSFVYFLIREKWALFNPEMSLMFNSKSIKNLAKIHNMKIEYLEHPYLEDVYSNIESDYQNIVDIIKGDNIQHTPFWGGVMTAVITLEV